MINYLFRKVVSLCITLFFVSMVCFFMIKLSPGDKADALLKLQGISLVNDSHGVYDKEYAEIREKLKLNIPWFYFSIRSSNEPKEFPLHWKHNQNELARKLLKAKIRSGRVISYVEGLSKLDVLCNDLNNEECLRITRFLYEIEEPAKVNQRISKLKSTPQIIENTAIAETIQILESNIEGLNDNIFFYFPKISFHGLKNQYHNWLLKIITFDLGVSVTDGQPVTRKVGDALKWTLVITLLAFFMSLSVGIPLGIYSARKQGNTSERIIESLMNIFYAVPVFWLATLLIVFFTTAEYGGWTNIFPSPSFRIIEDSTMWNVLVRNTKMMVLPVFCLTISALPIIVRLTKRSVLAESIQPYVRALKAKGLETKSIYRNHIVPNALIPIVTLVSNSLPVALAGSLIVEVIFNIPGMGRLMYTSIFNYDWDVCFAILLMISIITSLVLFVADVIYSRLNPKIRLS